MGRTKTLLKNSFFIFVGKIATVIANLLLLPLYTSIFSTAEYGLVDLVITIIALALPVITLYIEQGMFRYMIVNADENDTRSFVTSAFFFTLFFIAAYSLISIVVLLIIGFRYTFFIVGIAVSQSLFNWMLQYYRGARQLKVFALANFCSSLLTIVSILFFIFVAKFGIESIFLGNCFGPGFTFLVFFLISKIYKMSFCGKVDFSKIKKMLAYSVGLIPNSLSIWALNSSDRLLVTRFLGIDQNGILSVSHKFSSYYGYFNSTFLTAWQETGTIHFDDPDRELFFSEMLKKVFKIFASLAILVIAFIPLVFKILVNLNFYEAYNTIPIYVIAELINTLVGFFGVVYIAKKKTILISISTAIIALFNIIIHLSLIFTCGLFAAAISTLVSYALILIIRMVHVRKYIKIEYCVIPYIPYFIMLVISIYFYYLNSPLTSFIAFPFFVVIVCILNKDFIKGIFSHVKKKNV